MSKRKVNPARAYGWVWLNSVQPYIGYDKNEITRIWKSVTGYQEGHAEQVVIMTISDYRELLRNQKPPLTERKKRLKAIIREQVRQAKAAKKKGKVKS